LNHRTDNPWHGEIVLLSQHPRPIYRQEEVAIRICRQTQERFAGRANLVALKATGAKRVGTRQSCEMLERRRPRSIIAGTIVLEELVHADRRLAHLGTRKPGELAGQVRATRTYGNPGRPRPARFTINADAIGKRKAELTITEIFQRLAGRFHTKSVLHRFGRTALAHPLAKLGITSVRNHDQRGSGHAGFEKRDSDQIIAADGHWSRALGVARSMTDLDGFPGAAQGRFAEPNVEE